MRLTILNQFFYPDHSATSQLMTSLAEDLVRHGVEVRALSARGSYNGGQTFPSRETYNGVLIDRVWSTSFGKRTTAGRLSDYITFYLGATWKLLTMRRQHIVMALTTPPLIGLIALLVARLRGMRFVALMEDIYPDVAVALDKLHPGGLSTIFLNWLTRKMLQHADRIIVLDDCMYDRILLKVGVSAAHRIDVIHNWADGEEISPVIAGRSDFFAEIGLSELEDKFVVLFSGNLGLVNDFVTVLDAAWRLRDRKDIAFVFIGEGERSREIRERVRLNRLNNIYTLPYQPRERLRRSLAAGDALLVTLADGLAGLSVPSKIYTCMAAGRPILFVGDMRGSGAKLVMENYCGEAIAGGEDKRLAEIIAEWADDRFISIALGENARALFESRFDRRRAVELYLECFAKCSDAAVNLQPSAISYRHTSDSGQLR